MITAGDQNRYGAHGRLDRPRHVDLSADPATARAQLQRVLEEQWRGDLEGVLLALSEALVNANRHAGGARRAEAWVNGSSVIVQVCDRGEAFDPRPYTEKAPDAMAERGRGLWLISQLADTCRIHHDRDGGRVLLRFEVGDGDKRWQRAECRR